MKAFLLALAVLPTCAFAQSIDPGILRDRALRDDTAWDIVEGLTTEIGPRLAGTEAEARARNWAVTRLKALGFSNVRVETFEIDGWERGIERGEIISPYSQPLMLTALGGSAATPFEGLVGQIIGFESMAELEAASPTAVAGKIVFMNHRMGVTQDGSGYGAFLWRIRSGPAARSGDRGGEGRNRNRRPFARHQQPSHGAYWGDILE